MFYILIIIFKCIYYNIYYFELQLYICKFLFFPPDLTLCSEHAQAQDTILLFLECQE